MLLVPKLNEWEIDMEWQTRTIESLKAAKLYLKGEGRSKQSRNVLLDNIKFRRVKIYVRNKYGAQLRAMCMMKKTSGVTLIALFSAPHLL